MAASLSYLRCLLIFFILIQYVSLYKISVSEENHPDFSSSSFNEESSFSPQDEDSILNDSDDYKLRSKRSIRMSQLPERRNNRPHWNPLVAAYKRCGELGSREEREACFKDAVQMLFVHRL